MEILKEFKGVFWQFRLRFFEKGSKRKRLWFCGNFMLRIFPTSVKEKSFDKQTELSSLQHVHFPC